MIHEERQNRDTGAHEGHASHHRPTTHPPLGVPSHLAWLGHVSTLGLRDLLPGAPLYPKQALLALDRLALRQYFPFLFLRVVFFFGFALSL